MGVSKDNKQSTLVEILEENLVRKNKTVAVVNMDMDKRIKGAVRPDFRTSEKMVLFSSKNPLNKPL